MGRCFDSAVDAIEAALKGGAPVQSVTCLLQVRPNVPGRDFVYGI